MAKILELAEFAQHNGMTERQLHTRRVDAELHPQWTLLTLGRKQSLGQTVHGQDLGSAGGEDRVGLAQVRREIGRPGRFAGVGHGC
jgi:hypothetical protein